MFRAAFHRRHRIRAAGVQVSKGERRGGNIVLSTRTTLLRVCVVSCVLQWRCSVCCSGRTTSHVYSRTISFLFLFCSDLTSSAVVRCVPRGRHSVGLWYAVGLRYG